MSETFIQATYVLCRYIKQKVDHMSQELDHLTAATAAAKAAAERAEANTERAIVLLSSAAKQIADLADALKNAQGNPAAIEAVAVELEAVASGLDVESNKFETANPVPPPTPPAPSA